MDLLLRWGAIVLLIAVLSACSAHPVQGAIGASNVLVLYNQASPEGIAIADYYAQVHPGVQLLGLSNVTTNEEISASDYLNTIRPQILSALSPSIDVVVTTKGLPLRIANAATGPSSYQDPFNVTRSIPAGSWKQYSSLESELTRIDTISSVNQMGDNNFTSSTGKPLFPQPSSNPYYQSSAAQQRRFPLRQLLQSQLLQRECLRRNAADFAARWIYRGGCRSSDRSGAKCRRASANQPNRARRRPQPPSHRSDDNSKGHSDRQKSTFHLRQHIQCRDDGTEFRARLRQPRHPCGHARRLS